MKNLNAANNEVNFVQCFRKKPARTLNPPEVESGDMGVITDDHVAIYGLGATALKIMKPESELTYCWDVGTEKQDSRRLKAPIPASEAVYTCIPRKHLIDALNAMDGDHVFLRVNQDLPLSIMGHVNYDTPDMKYAAAFIAPRIDPDESITEQIDNELKKLEESP